MTGTGHEFKKLETDAQLHKQNHNSINTSFFVFFVFFETNGIHCKTPSTKQPSPTGWTKIKRRISTSFCDG